MKPAKIVNLRELYDDRGVGQLSEWLGWEVSAVL